MTIRNGLTIDMLGGQKGVRRDEIQAAGVEAAEFEAGAVYAWGVG